MSHRIVFYLTNLHIKSRTTFFARAGSATEEAYRSDGGLSEAGKVYAVKMTETLIKHREQERQAAVEAGGPDIPLRPLTVWTSTRLRTVQTAKPLEEQGYKIRQRSQMSSINPGVCEKLSERASKHHFICATHHVPGNLPVSSIRTSKYTDMFNSPQLVSR